MKILHFILTTGLILRAAPAFSQLMWGVNGAGGSGTWDDSTPNWWNGNSNVPWVRDGEAVFGGTAGTVSLNSAPSVGKLTFNVPGYILNSGIIVGTPGITVQTNADAMINSFFLEKNAKMGGTRTGIFTKTGAGTLTVASSISGFTRVAIAAGEMKFADVSLGSPSSVFSLADAPGVFLTIGVREFFSFTAGALSGGGANGGVIQPSNTPVPQSLQIGGAGGSFAGKIQDNGAGVLVISKTGTGLQELTGANTFSGGIGVFDGTLSFAGSGTALSSSISMGGGTLLLDNSGTLLADRLSDTLPVSLGGTLALKGNATAPVTETLGSLRFSGRSGTVSITPNPAQASALVFDTLAARTLNQSGVISFQGTGLGTAPGPGVASVRFLHAPALIGGSGLDGTPQLPIVPGALGLASAGTTFITYGSFGVRPLADTEFTSDLSAAGATGNVSLGTSATVSTPTSVNSLRLRAGGTVGGVGTLSVGSGMILAQIGSGPIQAGALDFGTSEGIIVTEGDLTIASSILGSNPQHGLAKNGPGRLTLTGASSFTGAVQISTGALRLRNAQALGTSSSPVTVTSGTSLEIEGGISIPAKPLILPTFGVGNSLRSLSGNNTWTGPISVGSPTISVGRATISVDAGSLTLAGEIFVSFTLNKSGPGMLVVTGPVVGNISVGAGTLKTSNTISGEISLSLGAALTGTGKVLGAVSGGVISPGNSAGILTAINTSPIGSLSAPTAYAFEFTQRGTPDLLNPAASGNDVLLLTSTTAPLTAPLTAPNRIDVYFNLESGVQSGDTFLGAFLSARSASFDELILGATWNVFLADPFGDRTFNGIRYRPSTDTLAVTTVPQVFDPGTGSVLGRITSVTYVPELGAGMLLLTTGLLAIARRPVTSGR